MTLTFGCDWPRLATLWNTNCWRACSANLILNGVSGKDLPQRESDAHEHRGQEPRELTLVQPLCVAKALKRTKWQLVLTSGCGAPFWRISAAHGSKRGPAPGKRMDLNLKVEDSTPPRLTSLFFLAGLCLHREKCWGKVQCFFAEASLMRCASTALVQCKGLNLTSTSVTFLLISRWTPFPAVKGRDPPKRGAATWPQCSIYSGFNFVSSFAQGKCMHIGAEQTWIFTRNAFH